MTEPIVRVEGIGKRYKIGAAQGKNTTLKTALTAVPRNAFLRLKGGHTRTEEFWALRDVDLDIAEGDVVGLVGRNGAGKSTLLKILSRIVEPTTGRAILDGRVASILEVGTGFHEELTGRENIYLNGAILGMRRREIQTKFDEIVEFAEIEKFLDTPVKFFSSGMYVRLAFAIAAHLDPDILIVDEVLAVGDEEFQKKSLGKMSSVARSGRTVIFVSHNTTALLDLCDHGVLLESGRLTRTGSIDDVVAAYTTQNANRGSGRFLATSVRSCDPGAHRRRNSRTRTARRPTSSRTARRCASDSRRAARRDRDSASSSGSRTRCASLSPMRAAGSPGANASVEARRSR